MVDMKDAALDEKIIGVEAKTLYEHGPGDLEPRQLPTPHRMLPAKEALHWLTHLPYDPACELCVQCKRPNSHHRGNTTDERVIPLLVGDYCFIKGSKDEEMVTGLVFKLYPFKLFFGCVVQTKGPDPLVVARLTQFIKDSGLVHFAYRSDKEPAIVAMIEEACARAGRRGIKVTSEEDVAVEDLPDEVEVPEPPAINPLAIDSSQVAVPEHSHPGESQSNGRAERAVQAVEDQVRTLKAAFELRFKMVLTNTHPVMAWLFEHAVFLLNKFQLGTDGRTGWGRLHGKETRDRICEFGECVLWYVPKKLRTKLDLRWRYGVFMGRSASTDQNFIGIHDGTIVGARAMVRLVSAKRWNTQLVTNIQSSRWISRQKGLTLLRAIPTLTIMQLSAMTPRLILYLNVEG